MSVTEISKKKVKIEKAEVHKCEFCKEKFESDVRLYNHLCPKKRKFQQRDAKSVKLGFMIFQRFCQKKANKTAPTIDKFEDSRLYSSFVGFAAHLININAINPIGYTDFLLAANIGINKWKNDVCYERYIRELSKTEEPLAAMERNIMLMQQWSVDTGEHWTEFFRKVATPQAVLWIKSGRLSPWLLFSVPESSSAMLKRMTPEQLGIVNGLIDAKYWQIKLERNAEEVERMKIILMDAGV
jgi:hypothetical protein